MLMVELLIFPDEERTWNENESLSRWWVATEEEAKKTNEDQTQT
jgi:hypothetical protein